MDRTLLDRPVTEEAQHHAVDDRPRSPVMSSRRGGKTLGARVHAKAAGLLLVCLAIAGIPAAAQADDLATTVNCGSARMEAWYPIVWMDMWPNPTANGSYVDAIMSRFKWDGSKWVKAGTAPTVRALINANGSYASEWTDLRTGDAVELVSVSPTRGYHRFAISLKQKVWGSSKAIKSTYQWLVNDGRTYDCYYR